MDAKLTLTEEAVHQAVKRAWTETLPRAPCGPTTEWADTSADSLDTLHLVLRLETYLGRKVPIDVVTPEMTTASLARLISSELASRKESEPSPVFLVPPLFGDIPIFADFRRSLSQHVWLQMVDLPDLGCPASVLSDMAATGRFVASEIIRRLPQGNILLAGFSFGGSVALEAAACLIAQGRQVVFLGLLDPVVPGWGDDTGIQESRQGARNWREPLLGWRMKLEKVFPHEDEDLFGYLDWLVFAACMKLKAFDAARRRILFAKDRLSPEGLLRRVKYLLGVLRISALKRWKPFSINVPTLLVLSETSIASDSPQAWPRFCSNLSILRLPGGHTEIFQPHALELLTPAFVEAVKAARVVES
jgi:thioesterase domain-containing protein